MEAWRAREDDVSAIQSARSGDPFAVLGPHQTPDGWVIRVFAPDAVRVRALTRDSSKVIAELPRRKDDFFEALIPSAKERPLYRVEVETADGTSSYIDSYAFGPALGPLDDYLLREGSHRQLYRRLGRPTHPARRRGRRAFCAVGSERDPGLHRRRFQPLGRSALSNAQAVRQWPVGDFRSAPRCRSGLQIRTDWPGWSASAAQSRSVRF